MPDRLSARVLPEWVEPAVVFAMIEPAEPHVFWLDAGAGAAEGWSFVGHGERSADGPGSVRIDVARTGGSGEPPFLGGWVGWCEYESGAIAAGADVVHVEEDEENGDAWIRAHRAVAFDHSGRRTWVLASQDDLDRWLADVSAAVDTAGIIPEPPGIVRIADARHTPAEYAELVEECRETIRRGIAYQLCLTTRFSVPGEHDAVAAYRRLRTATPAHHGGFVRIGGRTLLSASPEQFLQTEDGVVRTRPIKGTRPRSADPAEDAALSHELATDVKERAENVMIVDLMRNDLSRVCEPGSIRVDGLWQVESYPAVHQLVSTVSGVAAHGTTVERLRAAAFPAGSMTGAPKISAMNRLQQLEGGPRGVYAGCFGYVGVDGALDLAMVIRSILVTSRGAVVGAGGGITWRSVPASEVAEVVTKARAPLAALGAVLPGDWGSDILR